MKKLLTLLLLLIITFPCYGDLTIEGNYWTNKTKDLKYFFHQPEQPTAISVGDKWEDTENNFIYQWDGSDWNLIKNTADVQQWKTNFLNAKDDYEDNIGNVKESAGKECLKALKTMIMNNARATRWLYKETLE